LRTARRTVAFDLVQTAHHAYDVVRSAAATRLLLVSDGVVHTSEQQLAPFHRHRQDLRDRLGVVFRHRRLGQVMQEPGPALAGADVIGLKLAYTLPAAEAERIVRTIHAARPPGARLIYFDGDDDLAILWPALLPYVDLYVKKHVFRDRSMYERRFVGKCNLTDFVAEKYGVTYENDVIKGETGPVDRRYLDRVHLGYNLALEDKIVQLCARTESRWSDRDRPNDVVCRATFSGWLAHLRKDVAPILARLEREYRVIAPTQEVSQETYDQELASSKICVSPFGYGEICYRDFEAILWGCLMVKPDMSHVETRPDVFIPYETYVPVRWDFSDLESQCRRYLEDPAARQRIVDQAQAALSAYYREGTFVDEVAAMLAAVGIPRVT
jgi:hypothetical protein